MRPCRRNRTDDTGLGPGEFAELVRANLAGVAYVNVHTEPFPAGEIRGQLGSRHGRDHDTCGEDDGDGGF